VDHWYLRESLVLFGSQIDGLLSETTIVFAHRDHGRGRATENLMYLTHYYHRHFSPLLDMVIVEQGAQPKIDPMALPRNSKYVFLRDTNSFDRERCFATGISHADPSRKRVILSDNDIYLDSLHIRANLRMCERYDHVTGFSKLIDLTMEDSDRLRNTKTSQGVDIISNHSRDNGRDGFCLFLNREAIQTMGQKEEGSERAGSLLSLPEPAPSHVFRSPNHALRLT